MIGLTHCKLTAGDCDSRQKAKAVQLSKQTKHSKARVLLKNTMVHFTSFVLFVSILLSIVSITAQTQNQLGSKGTQQCTINNNFYAGSNKKENKTKGSYLDSLLTLYHFSL